jgi:hypothetical protein
VESTSWWAIALTSVKGAEKIVVLDYRREKLYTREEVGAKALAAEVT